MQNLPSLRVHSVFCFLVAAAVAIPAKGSGPLAEYPLSTEFSFPSGIAAGPDGTIWFSEFNRIARVTSDGTITEFPVHAPPGSITPGPDGNMWYTAGDVFDGDTSIGRISPTGDYMEFPISGLACGIVGGPDGNLWFTNCNPGNQIGRITPEGAITTFSLPPGHDSHSITAGPDGNLWFTDPAGGQIGRISTAGSVIEFPLPSGAHPESIVTGPDRNLWFAATSTIGRITTGGEIAEYPIAASALTLGSDGALWFVDATGNRVGRLLISPGTAHVDLELRIPTADAFPLAIAAGPDGAIWFTEWRGNALGRVDLSAVCGQGSLCLGGRFEVTTAWAGGGSSGTGKPLEVTSNAGAFSFFDSSNLEVFVKILDDCRGSGKFNVYVNGLTHLGVTVTVTDKRTGTSKAFTHPDGTPFSLLFDGSTFACP